ncbi:MAG: hypothetical protein H6717_42320 [Polyangiaceae bacterium]|nr:hypothetical protein [Polyangiaceae bacterium]
MGQAKRMWGFDDAERRLLFDATDDIPELREILSRAAPRQDLGGLWVLRATVDELDEIYSLVEALMDGTRSERRLEQLEELLAGLCTSMDGF